MCDHTISRAVLQANRGRVNRVEGAEFACAACESHRVALHRTVSRMVDCAECTELLVVHAYLVRPAMHGVQPTLAQLMRAALVLACSAPGDEARMQLQERIRAWYISSNTDPVMPEFATDPDGMAGPL